jgi:stage III sporulation protein AA
MEIIVSISVEIGKKKVEKDMLKTRDTANIALKTLPARVRDEVSRLCESRRGGISELREIRLRADGVCSILVGAEHIRLACGFSVPECEATIRRLCDGALYAHRDSIGEGYISIGGGIRVGVAGVARYDGHRAVGVSEMRSLVYRIPSGRCAFGDELYSIFLTGVRSGMLIYSSPGVGKTTALRSLAYSLGSGRSPRRVCVIDERFEFCAEDYSGAEVDLLGGYRRRSGLEIATRTMSPDVIMLDELGGEDAADILGVVRCGVPVVATAHAASMRELRAKSSLRPLLETGAFDLFVGIERRGGEYSLCVDRE